MQAPNAVKLVSVIIPAYNHAGFVAQCLDSVLADSYLNKEIIVIDDGSSDDTYDVVQKWKSSHDNELTIITSSRPNKGLSATLNEAISLAHGDYILPIASDDCLVSEGIGARVAYLENHPNLLAVFGDCRMIDENGGLVHASYLRDFRHANVADFATPEGVALSIAVRWVLPGPGLLARRELYTKIGGYDESRKVEDWDIYLRMAAIKTLGFVDTPVASYRFHASNACRKLFSQTFILTELSQSGFKRANLFSGKLWLIVVAKAVYYRLKAFSYYAQASLSKSGDQ